MSKFTVTVSFLPSGHSLQYQVLADDIKDCINFAQEKSSCFQKEQMADKLEVLGLVVSIQSTPGPVVL